MPLGTWIDGRVAEARMRTAVAVARRAAQRSDWPCAEALWYGRECDGGLTLVLLAGMGHSPHLQTACLGLYVLHAAALRAADTSGDAASSLDAISRRAEHMAGDSGEAAPGGGVEASPRMACEDVEAACRALSTLPPVFRRIVADVVARTCAGLGGRPRTAAAEDTPSVGMLSTLFGGGAPKARSAQPARGPLARDAAAHYRAGLLFIGVVRLAAAAGAERASLGAEEHLANAAGLLVHKAALAVSAASSLGVASTLGAPSTLGIAPLSGNASTLGASDLAWDALRHAPDAFLCVARLQDAGVFRMLAVPVAAALRDAAAVLKGAASPARSRLSAALALRDVVGLSEVRAVIADVHAQLAPSSGDDDDDGWVQSTPGPSFPSAPPTSVAPRTVSRVGSAIAVLPFSSRADALSARMPSTLLGCSGLRTLGTSHAPYALSHALASASFRHSIVPQVGVSNGVPSGTPIGPLIVPQMGTQMGTQIAPQIGTQMGTLSHGPSRANSIASASRFSINAASPYDAPLAQRAQRAMLVSRLGMLAARERNRSVASVPWVLSAGAVFEMLLFVFLGACALVLGYVAAQAVLDSSWAA